MVGMPLRSEGVPTQDRFDVRRAPVGRKRTSDAISIHASDFWAEWHLMELGPATVLPLPFPPTSYRRSPKVVSQPDSELCRLSLAAERRHNPRVCPADRRVHLPRRARRRHLEAVRTTALDDFLHGYKCLRCHMALGGRLPISRVNNADGQNIWRLSAVRDGTCPYASR